MPIRVEKEHGGSYVPGIFFRSQRVFIGRNKQRVIR